MKTIASLLVLFTTIGNAADSAAPKMATKESPFVNSLGMNFVPVPGTKVLFSIWDTRVQDYEEYARVNGITPNDPTFEQTSTHPVVNVDWAGAKAFCEWLTKKEGRTYRLPRESEWNVAVGSTKYPWGNQWPPPNNCGNYAGQEMRGSSSPFAEQISSRHFIPIPRFSDHDVFKSPVATYPANQFGLYDMGGNVWQWCEEWYNTKHKGHVLRGASWYTNDVGRLRSSYRRDNFATGLCYGFRCVLEESSD